MQLVWTIVTGLTSPCCLAFPVIDRLLIAAHALWFYAGKLVLPVDLTFSYPRWNISSHNAVQYIWPVAIVLLAAAIWFNRRRLGRGTIAAIAFFVATLSPLIGLIQNFTFRYSFVADHYQYLACLGLLALLAGTVTTFVNLKIQNTRALWIPGGAVVVALVALTWLQCGAYQDMESIMRDTIAKNPGSWMAHANLGMCYLNRGQSKEAIQEFETAIALNSNCFEAIRNLSLALISEGRYDEAVSQCEKALQISPKDFGTYNNLGLALGAKGKLKDAIEQYEKALKLSPNFLKAQLNLAVAFQRLGRNQDAVNNYRRVLALDPHSQDGLNNLAWILATAPEQGVRNGREALQLAEKAIRNSTIPDSFSLATLAAAYAENGRFAEAASYSQKAQEMATAEGSPQRAQKYRQLNEQIVSGRPVRDNYKSDQQQVAPTRKLNE